jgi:hypothetical protein
VQPRVSGKGCEQLWGSGTSTALGCQLVRCSCKLHFELLEDQGQLPIGIGPVHHQVLSHDLRVGLAAHLHASGRCTPENGFDCSVERRSSNFSSLHQGAVNVEEQQSSSNHVPKITGGARLPPWR